jgi:hypothetical protein
MKLQWPWKKEKNAWTHKGYNVKPFELTVVVFPSTDKETNETKWFIEFNADGNHEQLADNSLATVAAKIYRHLLINFRSVK